MNNIHPTLCLGHLQGTRASSLSAIIAIYGSCQVSAPFTVG